MNQLTVQKRCYTVEEAAQVLGIGRDLCYDMVKTGEIPSLHLGRIYRVPIVQLNAYLAGDLKREVVLNEKRLIGDNKTKSDNHQ